jgi:hypothetical protein
MPHDDASAGVETLGPQYFPGFWPPNPGKLLIREPLAPDPVPLFLTGLHLGALAGAGELAGGPRTLRYAVGALDQLSRRMRAIATADSAKHAEHASQRARRRRQPTPRALALSFRATWPPWVATDEHENPVFDRLGMLALDHQARGGVPSVDSDQYRMIVRDAYLLAGRQLLVDVDARKQMALRHQHKLQPARLAWKRSRSTKTGCSAGVEAASSARRWASADRRCERWCGGRVLCGGCGPRPCGRAGAG